MFSWVEMRHDYLAVKSIRSHISHWNFLTTLDNFSSFISAHKQGYATFFNLYPFAALCPNSLLLSWIT